MLQTGIYVSILSSQLNISWIGSLQLHCAFAFVGSIPDVHMLARDACMRHSVLHAGHN